MAVKDLLNWLKKEKDERLKNLQAWGEVARTPELRQEYTKQVAAPAAKKAATTIAKPVSEPLKYMYQGAYQSPNINPRIKSIGQGTLGAVSQVGKELAQPVKQVTDILYRKPAQFLAQQFLYDPTTKTPLPSSFPAQYQRIVGQYPVGSPEREAGMTDLAMSTFFKMHGGIEDVSGWKRVGARIPDEQARNILGVKKNATEKQINEAYKKLAVKFHPDKGGDPKVFQLIDRARNSLLEGLKKAVIPQGPIFLGPGQIKTVSPQEMGFTKGPTLKTTPPSAQQEKMTELLKDAPKAVINLKTNSPQKFNEMVNTLTLMNREDRQLFGQFAEMVEKGSRASMGEAGLAVERVTKEIFGQDRPMGNKGLKNILDWMVKASDELRASEQVKPTIKVTAPPPPKPPTEPFPWETGEGDIPMFGYKAGQTGKPDKVVFRGDMKSVPLAEMDTTKVFKGAEKESLAAFNNTPGLYFTSSIDNARAYGDNITEATINPKSKIINVNDAPKLLSRDKVEQIVRSNPRIKEWATNWDENFDEAVRRITNSIMEETDGNEFLKAIWADGGFTPSDFVEAMRKAGIDGIKVPKDGVNHFIIYNKSILDQPPKPPTKATGETLVQSEIDDRIARAEIGQEYGPTGVKKLLNRILNPLKNAPEPVQESANTWRKEVLTARTDANALARQFADIPAEDGWKMVRYIENPTPQTAQKLGFDPSQYQRQVKELRRVYDQAREEGLKKGLDIGYLDNYMNHVWKESWGEIATKVRGAGARPYFTKERMIPSLEEGMELGLTPKFTHPAQFVAHYKEALSKAVANKKLVDSLVENGQLVPAGDAPLDWQSINAPLFPKVTKMVDGKKQIVSDYKAPPNVAEAINSIFEFGSGQHSGLEDVMSFTANASKKLQEVSLTGGVGPANAFTYGQTIKEATSGRLKSPVTSFFRAWSDKSSKQFFAEKQPVVRMMNEEGIPVYHTGDYKKMYENLADNPTLKQKLGDLWDKAFNEATFKRFMPMLEVNFFEDAYNNALKSGLSEKEAQKLAGEATKNFYGIADNFARSKFVDDTISTAFFAPTFRESMVNFWINNAKALSPKNLGDTAYNANRKFLAGTVLTYILYNAANKALTGHSMSENKGGKELSVEIPVGDDRSIYVPMLPSVGTLPRRAGEMTGALLEGDVATATQKAGSLLSSPISLGSQLATNRTFYGAPIYQKDDPALKKIGQLGGYGLEQASPSYIGEPIAYLQGRKTPVETALGIMEMPAYPSSSTPEKPLPLANVSATQTLAASDNIPLSSTGTQEKPSLLESLFSLRKKDEPQELRELPQKTGDLAVIFGEAQKTLDSYEEKRVKTEYGQYETDKKRRDALTKLEEDRAYAQAVLERIKSERPEQLFEIGIQTYASGEGMSVEKRAEWAAGELSSVTNEEEFSEKIDQMLEAKVLTKDVVDMLREEYSLPVNRYTSGGKIKTIGGSGSGTIRLGSTPKFAAPKVVARQGLKLPTTRQPTTVKISGGSSSVDLSDMPQIQPLTLNTQNLRIGSSRPQAMTTPKVSVKFGR